MTIRKNFQKKYLYLFALCCLSSSLLPVLIFDTFVRDSFLFLATLLVNFSWILVKIYLLLEIDMDQLLRDPQHWFYLLPTLILLFLVYTKFFFLPNTYSNTDIMTRTIFCSAYTILINIFIAEFNLESKCGQLENLNQEKLSNTLVMKSDLTFDIEMKTEVKISDLILLVIDGYKIYKKCVVYVFLDSINFSFNLLFILIDSFNYKNVGSSTTVLFIMAAVSLYRSTTCLSRINLNLRLYEEELKTKLLFDENLLNVSLIRNFRVSHYKISLSIATSIFFSFLSPS